MFKSHFSLINWNIKFVETLANNSERGWESKNVYVQLDPPEGARAYISEKHQSHSASVSILI